MQLTTITRRVIAAATELHIAALLRNCASLDRAAERAAKRVDDQKSVVRWANDELARRRVEETAAEDAAHAEWLRTNNEIASLPRF